MLYGNVNKIKLFCLEKNKKTRGIFVSLGVTTGSSKLQWRLNARDGTLVFLQTEYKLIADHQNYDTIIARNEVLRLIKYKTKKKRFNFSI
jgi:hypothetical protein